MIYLVGSLALGAIVYLLCLNHSKKAGLQEKRDRITALKEEAYKTLLLTNRPLADCRVQLADMQTVAPQEIRQSFGDLLAASTLDYSKLIRAVADLPSGTRVPVAELDRQIAIGQALVAHIKAFAILTGLLAHEGARFANPKSYSPPTTYPTTMLDFAFGDGGNTGSGTAAGV